MPEISEEVGGWVKAALFAAGAPDLKYQAFVTIADTPMGQQPVLMVMLLMENPLVGQPPVSLASAFFGGWAPEEMVKGAVNQLIEKLAERRAELMMETPPPSDPPSGLLRTGP